MNARTNLITAILTLSLIVPAAASAISAQHPLPTRRCREAAGRPAARAQGELRRDRARRVQRLGPLRPRRLVAEGRQGDHRGRDRPRQVLKANASTLGLGAYSNWAAYVHGGSSQKVAKAITAAATTRTANAARNDSQRPVPC